jgi:hypothetical protein
MWAWRQIARQNAQDVRLRGYRCGHRGSSGHWRVHRPPHLLEDSKQDAFRYGGERRWSPPYLKATCSLAAGKVDVAHPGERGLAGGATSGMIG